MPYSTWHTYGYGVKLTFEHKKEVTLEKLQKLLELAPNFHKSIREWLEDCEIEEPTVEDYFDFDQDYNLGLATIIKEVVEEAEGVELCACDDLNGYKYVLYTPIYPWQITEKDKKQTKKSLKQLFNKYLSIILDDIPDVDFQECENGG